MSELIEVLLPSEQVEGTRSQVQRWLKAVGEPAKRHEPLVEIETDKVTVEVPSPADGVLAEIVAAEGADVAPGALLARLRAGAAADVPASAAAVPAAAAAKAAATPAAAPRAGGALSPAVRRLLAERGLAADQVRGSGEGGRVTVDDVLSAEPTAAAPARPAERAPEADAAHARALPHTPMRRRIAAHMVESLLRTAPHVTNVFQ
ncbi:MAG TPA: biotin/lipoyl-containing protein, partial [Steroidobacteraceae bacterium]|nr:biotin/lipoyl-containing protein [Steroidobacteraceae bacterium]